MLTSITRQHMLTVMSPPGIEPFSPGAVAVLATALEHAHRLGHGHLGSEHLLLAVASASHPVGAVLRDHGVTPERVEQEIRAGPVRRPRPRRPRGHRHRPGHRAGQGRGVVRAGGPGRAGLAGPRKRRPARLTLHRLRRPGVSAWLIRRWHRRRAAAGAPIPLRAATGLWRRDAATSRHSFHSPRAPSRACWPSAVPRWIGATQDRTSSTSRSS